MHAAPYTFTTLTWCTSDTSFGGPVQKEEEEEEANFTCLPANESDRMCWVNPTRVWTCNVINCDTITQGTQGTSLPHFLVL